MPTITFVHPDGHTEKIEGASGETILKIALDHNVPMEHACGGNGFCNTCLCEVTAGKENLSKRNDQEETMGATETQRLGCQATVQGDVTVKLLEV
jgi:ferredoxin